ncbi:MAG: hypothetical protein AM326_12495 [Candidatus Thorarchaeota archaeon SMTZ-45]|nr:MAG: hypothetical protein AM326_12495 [Candidatus Thorarchaeota archaeon SMTZ-45]
MSLNNFSYNSYGIFIIDSISITVDDNTCNGNFFYGIQIVDSNSNLLTNNYCDDNLINGIYLYNASLSTVSGNTCNGNDDRGILLESSSDNNILEDNVCNANNQVGIHLLGSSFNNLTRNVCTFSSFGIRLQDHGDNNTVVSNRCTNNTMLGMLLTYADYNGLIGNNCSSNHDHGIHMWYSHFNAIANGIYSSNGDNGIWNAGDSNHITNNICSRNGYGISFDPEADFGIVMWNVLEDNSKDNGVDLGANNDFNYNYWSDYAGADVDQDGIGDTAHAFDYNSDSNPLMYYPFPPEWAQTPTDQVMEFGNIFEYTLEFIVTVKAAPYELAVDDSMNFAIDTGDRIISRTALAVGVYPLEIVATNIYGFTTEGGFTITVQDTTPPTIIPGEDITYIEGETDHELQWTLSDLSSLTYTLLRNGTEVTSDDTPRQVSTIIP